MQHEKVCIMPKIVLYELAQKQNIDTFEKTCKSVTNS